MLEKIGQFIRDSDNRMFIAVVFAAACVMFASITIMNGLFESGAQQDATFSYSEQQPIGGTEEAKWIKTLLVQPNSQATSY